MLARSFALCILMLFLEKTSFAGEKLSIISPNSKSIQQEIIPRFKKYYKDRFKKEIEVDWLSQGGASDDLRFTLARFDKNPKTSGIDIFWGGGEQPHLELKSRKLLQRSPLPSKLKDQIPQKIGGLQLYDNEQTWHAVNLSSFGIFSNTKLLKLLKIPVPTTWKDFGKPQYFGMVSIADPRRSSSHLTMFTLVVQRFGWKKGWALLTHMAANTQNFAQSSTAPIKAIVSGAAALSPSVGYFANAKITELKTKELSFTMPKSEAFMNTDPISILKGAPNHTPAKIFIEFILSSQTQKLFVLPQGFTDGPSHAFLGRLSVNRQTYKETSTKRPRAFNPFELKSNPVVLDKDKATRIQFVLADLFGAVLVDSHEALKKKAQNNMKENKFNLEKALFEIKESTLLSHAKKWDDAIYRNKTINAWLTETSKQYR